MTQSRSTGLPAALVVVSLLPVVAGLLRVLEVAGGPLLLPANPRIEAFPLPLVLHVLAAAAYALGGAFQLSAAIRRRHPRWHRRAGRVLVGAGLVVALSGIWMTLVYPDAPGGVLLWTVRLVVGSATAASIVLGVAAIRRRDIAAHRAWMVRAYALALGAATQTLTEGVGEGLFGTGDLSKALSMTAGWAINLALAEWFLHDGAGRASGHAKGEPWSRTPLERPARL